MKSNNSSSSSSYIPQVSGMRTKLATAWKDTEAPTRNKVAATAAESTNKKKAPVVKEYNFYPPSSSSSSTNTKTQKKETVSSSAGDVWGTYAQWHPPDHSKKKQSEPKPWFISADGEEEKGKGKRKRGGEEEEDEDSGGEDMDPMDMLGQPDLRANADVDDYVHLGSRRKRRLRADGEQEEEDDGGENETDLVLEGDEGEERYRRQKDRNLLEEYENVSDTDRFSIKSFDDKPTEPNIATRTDNFIHFFSLACGHPALPISDYFSKVPPNNCTDYESYKRYLLPSAKTALQETNTFIMRLSKRKLKIEHIIDMDPDDPLVTSASRLVGTFLRRAIMDNPNKSVPTRPGSGIIDRDMNRAKIELIRDIQLYFIGQIRNLNTTTEEIPKSKISTSWAGY